MTRQEYVAIFMGEYVPALEAAVAAQPTEYAYPVSEVPIVAERMRAAFERGSYNHTGYAIKLACKRLGIKHTRGAMEAFFDLGVGLKIEVE